MEYCRTLPNIEEHIKFYTIKEINKLVGIPKTTLRRLIRDKTLPTFKQGNSYYISKNALDKYISDKTLAMLVDIYWKI